jgi:hypothetical protein
MKQFLKRLLLLGLALFIAVMLFIYYAQYSSGVRSGVVVKISEKGVIFKTAEGQLNLQSFGAIKQDANQLSEVFEFTVEGDRQDIFRELEEVSLTGERVSLHYIERYARLPWRGDTKIFVERVERNKNPVVPEERTDVLSH